MKNTLDFSGIEELSFSNFARPTYEEIKSTYENLKLLIDKDPEELNRHVVFLNFMEWIDGQDGNFDLNGSSTKPPETCPCDQCLRAIESLERKRMAKIEASRAARARRPVTEKHDSGYIYLLKSGVHYKIGKTRDINKRIKQLTVNLPDPCQLIHQFQTESCSSTEELLHRKFDSVRKNGEWFALTDEQVQEIISIRGDL